MSTTQLSLKSAHLLPGLAEDFQQQLEAVVQDCRQRPSLAKKRTVTVKFTVIPDPEDPDDVLISPVISRATPSRQIQPIRARRTTKNQLQFDFVDEDL